MILLVVCCIVIAVIFMVNITYAARGPRAHCGAVVALLVGRRTYDLQVAGSSPGCAPCVVALDKLLTPVCLCH